jgi:hypothetical protein
VWNFSFVINPTISQSTGEHQQYRLQRQVYKQYKRSRIRRVLSLNSPQAIEGEILARDHAHRAVVSVD